METVERVMEIIHPFLPYLIAAIPFVFGVVALAIQGQLDNFLRETVAAVYRVALHAAAELGDAGLEWLRGPEGIAYRKAMAESAYDLLPEKIGRVPVGLVKAVITRDQFVALVERAFQEIVELADQLELRERLNELRG